MLPTDLERTPRRARPQRATAGHQRWREIVFLHWAVDPEIVRPLIHPSLELDVYHGKAWVTVIPFTARGTRFLVQPEALARDFFQTNVRTYVRTDENGIDRGVTFLSLETSSPIEIALERFGLGLPFHLARITSKKTDDTISYSVQRISPTLPRLRVECRLGAHLQPPRPGTLEQFLLERYVVQVVRTGSVWSIPIHHAPFPLQEATLVDYENDLLDACGLPPEVGESSPIVQYAWGVDAETFVPFVRRLRAAA